METIVFSGKDGTRLLQAIGDDWRSLIGARGVVPIDDAELERLRTIGKVLLIRLEDAEMDQMEIKTPEQDFGRIKMKSEEIDLNKCL